MNNIIVNSTITSIKVSLISVLITFFISITFIYFNSYKKNKKKSIMDILILLPMFVPPSAIGYIILITLGKNSFIGVILEKYFNIRIIFTIQACIIASVIVTLPLMYQSIKTSIFAIDQDIINASKLDGASDFKIFTKIILPLCKNGIYNGILLSFARSLGEFGATILVAGNIPGKTQTLPMAMYNAIEANQTKTTIIILFVILSISILLIIIYHNLNKDKI
nr:molybdate ABC transporter permease subunit [uncultured Romboutsia sp.]